MEEIKKRYVLSVDKYGGVQDASKRKDRKKGRASTKIEGGRERAFRDIREGNRTGLNENAFVPGTAEWTTRKR